MLIGEVSHRCGVSTRMLRHYHALGLVRPTGRTSGGYREYAADDVRRLFHVESLRTLGLSLGEAKQALDDPSFAPAELVGDLIRHTRARIAAEQKLLATLERVDAAAPMQWEDVLGLVTLLRGLESDDAAERQRTALSQTGSSQPVDTLVEAYFTEDDPNVAGALLWSLERADGGGLSALAAGLGAADVTVRRRAAAALAAVRSPEALHHLSQSLSDPDVAVRDTAALGLRSVESVPMLVEMVVAGRRDVDGAEALGELARRDDADPIVAALLDGYESRDLSAKLRIVQALGEIPGPAAAHALDGLTRARERWVAATAAAVIDARSECGPT